MHRIAVASDAAASTRRELGWALARVAAGLWLLPHGLAKWPGWFGGPGLDGFRAELAAFGLPDGAGFALAVALLQTVAGLFLAAGCFTRVAAALAAGYLAVAAAVTLGQGWFWMGGGSEYVALWIVLCLAFALGGGGRFSLDGAPHVEGVDRR